MEAFVVLIVATIIIVALSVLLWVRFRDLSMIAGISLLYFFLLYGGWSIVSYKAFGYGSEARVDQLLYLESRIFRIDLDDAYLYSIVLYAFFIIIVQACLHLGLHRKHFREPGKSGRYLVCHVWPWLTLGIICSVGGLYLVQDELGQAIALNVSPYQTTRWTSSPLITVFQTLDTIATLICGIAAGVFLSSRYARWCRMGPYRFPETMGLGLFVLWILLVESVLGNRNVLLASVLLGTLIYVNNTQRIRWVNLAVAFAGLLVLVNSIGLIRGVALGDRISFVTEKGLSLLGPGELFLNSESLAVHMSLYGVLSFKIPLIYGYSFFSLAASAIPRIFWSDRPEDCYVYYAQQIGLPSDQGFTISHVAGWYLNMAEAGVIMGAVSLGLLWVLCFRIRSRFSLGNSALEKSLGFTLPVSFAAGIGILCRAGPEGYKSLIIWIGCVWLVMYVGMIFGPVLKRRDKDTRCVNQVRPLHNLPKNVI